MGLAVNEDQAMYDIDWELNSRSGTSPRSSTGGTKLGVREDGRVQTWEWRVVRRWMRQTRCWEVENRGSLQDSSRDMSNGAGGLVMLGQVLKSIRGIQNDGCCMNPPELMETQTEYDEAGKSHASRRR